MDQWAWIPGYLKLNRRDNLRLFLELQIGFCGHMLDCRSDKRYDKLGMKFVTLSQ